MRLSYAICGLGIYGSTGSVFQGTPMCALKPINTCGIDFSIPRCTQALPSGMCSASDLFDPSVLKHVGRNLQMFLYRMQDKLMSILETLGLYTAKNVCWGALQGI